jgi:hypothetical protein
MILEKIMLVKRLAAKKQTAFLLWSTFIVASQFDSLPLLRRPLAPQERITTLELSSFPSLFTEAPDS